MFVLLELTLEVERRKRNFLSLGKEAQTAALYLVHKQTMQPKTWPKWKNAEPEERLIIYDHEEISELSPCQMHGLTKN